MKKSFIKKLLIVCSLTASISFVGGLLNPITAKADGQGILEEVQLVDFYGNHVGSPFTIPVISCTRDPGANDYTVVLQASISRNGVTYTLGGIECVSGNRRVVRDSSLPDGSIIDDAGLCTGDSPSPIGYIEPVPSNIVPPSDNNGGSASSGGSTPRSSGGTSTRTSGGTSSRTSGSSRTSTSSAPAPKANPSASSTPSAPSAKAPTPAQVSTAPSASTVNAIAAQLMANAGVKIPTASGRMLPTFVLTVEYLCNGQKIADNEVVLAGLGRMITLKAKDIPGYTAEYKTVTVLSSKQNMAQSISFKYIKKSDKKTAASISAGSNLSYHNGKIIAILVFAAGAVLIIFIIKTIKK